MKKYLLALTLVGLVATSCYEKLNIAPPNNITTDQVMELLDGADDETVVTIMGAMAEAIPSSIKATGFGSFVQIFYAYSYASQVMMRELSGNDVVLGRTVPSGDIGSLYSCTNLINSSGEAALGFWKYGYNMVATANKVYTVMTFDMVDNSTSAAMKAYGGWGLITRAYAYLYLLENYADDFDGSGTSQLGVPIYTVYDLSQDLKPRASESEVFDSIFTWLDRGISYLSQSTSDYGNSYAQNDAGNINLGFAYFVQARAALCAHKWDVAITACDNLINNYPGLMTEEQYVQVSEPTSEYDYVWYADGKGFMDLSANPENIFGYSSTNNTHGAQNGMFNWADGGQDTRMDDRLYNQIDDNDYRKDNFLIGVDGIEYNAPGQTSFTDGTNKNLSEYLNLKFAANVCLGGSIGDANTATNSGQIDYCFIRLSEAYLMKAEAQAQQGNESAAKETLNTLLAARTKSGATTLTCDNYSSMSGLSALEMVQLQTRIEMWGERGLEWYNNRRWNIPVNRSGSTVHHNPSLTYPVSSMTLQIPDNEMQTNPYAVQNSL